MSSYLFLILDRAVAMGVDLRLFDEAAAILLVVEDQRPFGVDSSIESMNSQEFSVAIFYFLVTAIIIFACFVFMFMFKDKKVNLKLGEKILFVWLLLGIVVAVLFGAAQMLHGYLF